MTHSRHLNEASLKLVSNFVVRELLKLPLNKHLTESQLTGEFLMSTCPVHVSEVCCGMKCWSSLHVSFENNERLMACEAVNDILDNLLRILYVSLRSRGKCIGGLILDSEDDVVVSRETVACLMIQLLEIDRVSKKLTSEHWEVLGWYFLDEDAKVRYSVAESFSRVIQTSGLHIRFLAYSSLTVFDQKCFQVIKKSLPFALKRIRCTHDELIGRAMEADDLKLLALMEEVIPECIVPYVVYLLSCLPFQNTFLNGKSCDDYRVKMTTVSLRFIYASLKSSLSEGSDNLSYLIQQLNLLAKQVLKGRDSSSLISVTKIARQILHENIKTVENVQPFKGNIGLPGDLFIEQSPSPNT